MSDADVTTPPTSTSSTTTTDGPTCRTCGNAIPWAGKGRRPTTCETCKTRDRKPRSSSSARKPGSVSSAQLEAAVANVSTLYSLIATGLMVSGAQQAASELAGQLEQLEATNREFLARDPKLVALLNKGASTTGRAGFIVSNLFTLAPIARLAALELGQRYGKGGDAA